MTFNRILSLCCVTIFAVQLFAADPPTPPAEGKANSQQWDELRRKIAAQEKEIQRLQQAVAEQKELLDSAVKTMAVTNAVSAGSGPQLVNIGGANASRPFQISPAAQATETHSPLSFRIGESDFTPFGFMDFTSVFRSTNTGSGIGSGFGSIPFSNTVSGRLTENNFSAQNSRIGLRVDSTVHGAKILGYLEADFLGNQPANIFVTSNADTLRMRNYFVDIRKGSLEVMAGQDWSLLTPGRKGISPIPGDLFYTQNMDTNYQAGLTWARQTQFRVGWHPSDNFHLALSLENPQQYIGSTGVTFPAALSSVVSGQFNDTTTNYKAPNVHPDVIVKAAFDGKPGGLQQHLEVAGLLRTFKYFNNAPGFDQSFSKVGGGASLNGNFEVWKGLRLITNNFISDGGGRYLYGLGPDLIVRPSGDISLVHSYSTVDGFEANLTKNLLLSSYYGGVYIGRNSAIDDNGKPVGYGYTGSSNSSNRSIQEFTIGLTPTIWKSPQYGALQLITQYSYVWRNPWYVAPGSPKDAKTNMVFIDLRYTLP